MNSYDWACLNELAATHLKANSPPPRIQVALAILSTDGAPLADERLVNLARVTLVRYLTPKTESPIKPL